MKFRVIHQKTPSGAHSPYQVVEQPTGRGVGWINRFLDREYVRLRWLRLFGQVFRFLRGEELFS